MTRWVSLQVLAPMHRGPLGTDAINKALQVAWLVCSTESCVVRVLTSMVSGLLPFTASTQPSNVSYGVYGWHACW